MSHRETVTHGTRVSPPTKPLLLLGIAELVLIAVALVFLAIGWFWAAAGIAWLYLNVVLVQCLVRRAHRREIANGDA